MWPTGSSFQVPVLNLVFLALTMIAILPKNQQVFLLSLLQLNSLQKCPSYESFLKLFSSPYFITLLISLFYFPPVWTFFSLCVHFRVSALHLSFKCQCAPGSHIRSLLFTLYYTLSHHMISSTSMASKMTHILMSPKYAALSLRPDFSSDLQIQI